MCIYSGNDNFAGAYTLNAGTKLETEEWSTGFDAASVSQILLVKGTTSAGFDKWVYADYDKIVPSALTVGWSTMHVLKTQSSPTAGTVKTYWVASSNTRESSPWIFSDSSTEENIVFYENNGADTGIDRVWIPDSFDDGRPFYVLVR